jgi:hypothetical protein
MLEVGRCCHPERSPRISSEAPPRHRSGFASALPFARQRKYCSRSAFSGLRPLHRTAFAGAKVPVQVWASQPSKNPTLLHRVFTWWLLPDSNWGHKALQASALPTELKSRCLSRVSKFAVAELERQLWVHKAKRAT